jgi:23S rRNA (guanosine2251-2'-O)-methyltransferase
MRKSLKTKKQKFGIRGQKQNRGVLQNKIKNDLFIVGKSAIKELIPEYSDKFEFVLFPTNTNSKKINDVIDLCRKYRISVIEDSSLIKEFEKMDIDSSGVAAVLKERIGKTYSLKEVLSLVDRLDNITAVAFPETDYEQNLGAMIRTCMGLNVDFILVPHSQKKVFSSTVTKVAMGYNYIIPVVEENFLLALETLRDKDFDLIGLDMEGENIQNMRYNSRVCFVMGNEGRGLTETVLKKCTKRVSIPMNNVVESLNVSVSLGITLYDRNLKLTL